MQINNACIDNGCLLLSMPIADARAFAYKFKPGEYEIRPAKKKRSIDANAYAWALINLIAEAVKLPPRDVYKQALENIPNICQIICMKSAAAQDMERLWLKDHIGRRVQTQPSQIPGCTTMFLYFGSSDFDSRQMSMLIDNLIQDAHTLGIETRPQEEINALLEAWHD